MYRWLHRAETTNSVKSIKNSGRPRGTTPQEDADIVEYIQNQPFSNAARAARLFGVGRRTASRRIKEAGRKCQRAAKRVKLTEEHRNQRVQFCQEMLDKKDVGLIDFRNIVFTDEKTFCTDVVHAKLVYRPPNTRYDPQYVANHSLSGRIAGGYWGWICVNGPGELVQIDGRFNSHKYKDLLEDVGIPSIDIMFAGQGHAEVIYMHDNSRIHKSHLITDYLQTVGFSSILNWPANSPDLNPIERVWAKVTRDWPNVQGQRTRRALDDLVMTRWDELRDNLVYFENLYEGLEDRFQYVINHDGYCHP